MCWSGTASATAAFPDAAKLKQLVRDVIDPDRDLGHSDRKGHTSKDQTQKDPA